MKPINKTRLLFFLPILLILILAPLAHAVENIPSSSAETMILGADQDYIGLTLATGDINCDQSLDLVFSALGGYYNRGSQSKEETSNVVYVLFGPFISSMGDVDLNTTQPDIAIISPSEFGGFGLSVVVDDLNNDGCGDIIVGDPYSEPGFMALAGEVSVLFGRPDPPPHWQVDWSSQPPDLTFYHDVLFNYLGESVATGDFDGDGNADLFISGVSWSKAGAIYVVRGPFQPSPSTPRDFSDNPPDLKIIGTGLPGTWQNTRYHLEDVDQDGRKDLVVGIDKSVSPFSTGNAYLFYGRDAADLPVVWDLEDTPPDVSVNSGSGDFFSTFGRWVLLADYNDDQQIDLLVSDPEYMSGFRRRGALFMLDHDRLTRGAVNDLSVNPADLTVIGAGSSWDFFDQFTVVPAGNGPSLIATAPMASYGRAPSGGAVTRLDQELLTNPSGTVQVEQIDPTAVYYGTTMFQNFGQSLQVGDLDGNERLDLIVGAQGDDPFYTSGAIYLFFDQIDTTPEPLDDDDDTDDDDSGDLPIDDDDDSLSGDLTSVIEKHDELGGCRCL